MDPWVGKILSTSVFWPGEFHGLYSPWCREELNTSERHSHRTSDLIFCPNVNLGLRCCANLCFIYAYSPCCPPHPFPRCSSQTLNICGSHICVIILFYGPGIFSVLTQWFGYHIPLHIYILLANVYILIAPTFNPMVYGIKTKQIRDLVVHLLFPKQI